MRSLIRKQPESVLAFGVATVLGILSLFSTDSMFLLIFYLLVILLSPLLGRLFAKAHRWLQAKGHTSRLAQMLGGVAINSGLVLLAGLLMLPLAGLVSVGYLSMTFTELLDQFENLRNVLNLFGFFLMIIISLAGPIAILGNMVIYLLLVVLFFSGIYPWLPFSDGDL